MTLVIGENLPSSWCGFPAPHGINATHWKDIGRIGDPDEVIFDYARKHQPTLVTQDLDFSRLLALRGSNLPSIIQLRVQCPTPDVIGPALLNVLWNYPEQMHSGCLISIESRRHRLRILPLR